MNTFTIGRQTERVGLNPTLSVMVADERGAVLEQVSDYHKRYIQQDDVDDEGNAPFYGFVNHVMLSLFLRPLDWRT